jgi:hypothetical protein
MVCCFTNTLSNLLSRPSSCKLLDSASYRVLHQHGNIRLCHMTLYAPRIVSMLWPWLVFDLGKPPILLISLLLCDQGRDRMSLPHSEGLSGIRLGLQKVS